MVWNRIKDDDARMMATRALGAAESARQAIEQHMIDCNRRYDQLRSDGDKRVADLRADGVAQHQENQRRMDSLERGQDGLNKGQSRIFWAMMSGMGLLALALIEAGLRMLHG